MRSCPIIRSRFLLYREEFALRQADAARRFMRAYIRAVRFYNDALRNGRLDGPTADEVIAILSEATPIKSREIYKLITPTGMNPDGRVNKASLVYDLAFYTEQGLIKGDVNLDDVIDGSFVEAALNALGPNSRRLHARSEMREATVLARTASMADRIAMYNGNALKIGVFGANCSSGRSATKVPERWSASWPDCLAPCPHGGRGRASISCCRSPAGRAMAARPIFTAPRSRPSRGRSACWARPDASPFSAQCMRPLFHPLIAAKEFVTADHIGEGRVGVNLVVGWNEGEFDMFGVEQREHDVRYEFAQEWIDVVKRAWCDEVGSSISRVSSCGSMACAPIPSRMAERGPYS